MALGFLGHERGLGFGTSFAKEAVRFVDLSRLPGAAGEEELTAGQPGAGGIVFRVGSEDLAGFGGAAFEPTEVAAQVGREIVFPHPLADGDALGRQFGI